jgi:diaminopimelate epimerase
MTNFDKMHGNGNDFVVVNSIEKELILRKSLIKKLSDRNSGIGFDQLILINVPTKDNHDFAVKFFNADGGEASMCLNGIRSAASYIWRHDFAPKKSVTIKTKNRLVRCEPVKNKIRVNIKISDIYKNDHLYKKISNTVSNKFDLVDSGNMHLCIKQSSIKNVDMNTLYKNLAKHIKPLGCNLSIYKLLKGDIDIRTYENGVGETLSCGSAALAVASLCIKDKCKVRSSGGTLNFKKRNNDTMEMIGPAEFVFSGSFDG